ncbi:MAG TPA: N-acetylmuramoyl-L-alanine amidase [Candidatus Moranbacteria bacterium]|nr:N-acetylmuramoyl-L-alanine amidase [Candidatus Moranbacteria bacterium]HRZ33990.1 N-acetylmuramoyl-L-alanine amidase [Candidatus Moranbacteria bacterium]
MQKRIIISIIIFIAIILLVIFGFILFRQKKTIQISVQSQQAINNGQEAENSNQKSENGNQETGNSIQEVVINDKQQTTIDKEQTTSSRENKEDKIISRLVSWGFKISSNRKIDTIIVHSAYDAIGNDPYSVEGVIAEYKQYGVSPHYLIDRGGKIYRLVADQDIAYHAGTSKMPDGRTDVNNFSVGIEMINIKEGKFTDNQYDSLNWLIDLLKKQYQIKYVLGHNDIAPGRKTDPWNIDWDKIDK